MTTTPRIDTELISIRIAFTAAPSAPFLSPRPTHLAGGHRRGLGHPGELEGQVTVGRVAGWRGLLICGDGWFPSAGPVLMALCDLMQLW